MMMSLISGLRSETNNIVSLIVSQRSKVAMFFISDEN